MASHLSAAVLVALLAVSACSGDEEPRVQPTPSTPGATSPSPTAPPQPFDLGAVKIRLRRFASGLDQPLFLTHAGDGSGLLYVVEQPGRIRVFARSGEARGTFLDIAGRITAGGEQGLLGLAFHPEYESNGRFFVYYTDSTGDNQLSEFRRRSSLRADPGSERTVLHFDHPTHGNHNGGWIGFGPDGFLYIGTGDGGGGGDPRGNGQRLDTLLGKILRVDVGGSPYRIPDDNPFVGRSGARREIWAYGLRNPWRSSFDRSTGDLWIGDVGQGSREEVDVQAASSKGGLNYGWNIMEGSRCFGGSSCDRSGLTAPITEYPTGEGCAVTGGYVYRGGEFPSLVGGYFFGDYCNGRIFAVDAARALKGATGERLLLRTELSISSFGEDESGELYVIDLGGAVSRLIAG